MMAPDRDKPCEVLSGERRFSAGQRLAELTFSRFSQLTATGIGCSSFNRGGACVVGLLQVGLLRELRKQKRGIASGGE